MGVALGVARNSFSLAPSGQEFIIDRDIEQNRRLDYIDRYYLYPYFGGQKTAPHDIKIKIKE